ncbi:hypothetical protein AGOR_G00148210 [Albula goreensis]|uniref:Uncharacterized protein n=1 Tax=Albula goreensis TaxID=1534307 RepID=A0A8T3D2P5_9TELE|nr:hypothetical protein AGOR_G00148210 [Albula goreensis]
MQLQRVLVCVPIFILWTLSVSSSALDTTKSPAAPTAIVKVPKPDNNTHNVHNDTATKSGSLFPSLNVDSSMIQRALYVLIGITIIGVLYFLVRAVRLKKTTQRKKYGLLSDQDDNMEMAHLESEEEDMTVYEAKPLRR